MAGNRRNHTVVEMRRRDVYEPLADIIREATVALRRKDLEAHIECIHRNVHLLERKIKRLEEERRSSEIERAFAKAEADG